MSPRNETIVIEDDKKTFTNLAPRITSVDFLCEFPVGQSPCVTVAMHDYRTLEHKIFLNDIVIDFYSTYLQSTLNPLEINKVHIFSTMFYKRLTTTPAKVCNENIYEKDITLTEAEIRYLRVKKWTKKVNLFEKEMVIFTICEESRVSLFD